MEDSKLLIPFTSEAIRSLFITIILAYLFIVDIRLSIPLLVFLFPMPNLFKAPLRLLSLFFALLLLLPKLLTPLEALLALSPAPSSLALKVSISLLSLIDLETRRFKLLSVFTIFFSSLLLLSELKVLLSSSLSFCSSFLVISIFLSIMSASLVLSRILSSSPEVSIVGEILPLPKPLKKLFLVFSTCLSISPVAFLTSALALFIASFRG